MNDTELRLWILAAGWIPVFFSLAIGFFIAWKIGRKSLRETKTYGNQLRSDFSASSSSIERDLKDHISLDLGRTTGEIDSKIEIVRKDIYAIRKESNGLIENVRQDIEKVRQEYENVKISKEDLEEMYDKKFKDLEEWFSTDATENMKAVINGILGPQVKSLKETLEIILKEDYGLEPPEEPNLISQALGSIAKDYGLVKGKQKDVNRIVHQQIFRPPQEKTDRKMKAMINREKSKLGIELDVLE